MNSPAGGSSILALRRRSVWEAADSGILLWRKTFIYLIPLFALPVWIAASALMFLPNNYRWVSWAALWWLKPLFDRLCLHIVSVKFFQSETDDNTATFKNITRGLGRIILHSLPGDLLWRRFSLLRSATMPLRLLERPKYKQYRERKKTLAAGGLNFGAVLTCIGPVIELILLGGEIIFVRMFFEMFFPGASWSMAVNNVDTGLFIFAAYCFNYILIESLYVSMGFGVYINSRIETEGWDIQLLFLKFSGKNGVMSNTKAADSVNFPKGLAAKPPALMLLLILVLTVFALPLKADSMPQADEPINYFPHGMMESVIVPHDDLKEILSSKDFGGTQPGWTIRFKNRTEHDPLEFGEIDYGPWVQKIRELLSHGLRILIVLTIAVSAVLILRRIKEFGFSKESGGRYSDAYLNSLIEEEAPEVLFEKAEQFYKTQKIREAWGSCLRGSIGACTKYYGLVFPFDSTEYGCLDIIKKNSAVKDDCRNLTDGFETLVKHWIFMAYGGQNPPEGSFEKALLFGKSIGSVTVTQKDCYA